MTPRWTAHTEDGAGLSLVKENGHLLIEVYGNRHPSLAREVAAAMNGEHPDPIDAGPTTEQVLNHLGWMDSVLFRLVAERVLDARAALIRKTSQ